MRRSRSSLLLSSETAQDLHRDQDAWFHYQEGRPELSLEAMFALSDFHEKNGATRIVPGSHTWEDSTREPTEDETAVAEMRAGSAVVYLRIGVVDVGSPMRLLQKESAEN